MDYPKYVPKAVISHYESMEGVDYPEQEGLYKLITDPRMVEVYNKDFAGGEFNMMFTFAFDAIGLNEKSLKDETKRAKELDSEINDLTNRLREKLQIRIKNPIFSPEPYTDLLNYLNSFEIYERRPFCMTDAANSSRQSSGKAAIIRAYFAIMEDMQIDIKADTIGIILSVLTGQEYSTDTVKKSLKRYTGQLK